ncbi:MAG: trypsin-like peptidase domain-containing protein [Pseudomonadota bacterium]
MAFVRLLKLRIIVFLISISTVLSGNSWAQIGDCQRKQGKNADTIYNRAYNIPDEDKKDFFEKELPPEVRAFYSGSFLRPEDTTFLLHDDQKCRITSALNPLGDFFGKSYVSRDNFQHIRLIANFFQDKDDQTHITFCTGFSFNVLVMTAAHCLNNRNLEYSHSVALEWFIDKKDIFDIVKEAKEKPLSVQLQPIEMLHRFGLTKTQFSSLASEIPLYEQDTGFYDKHEKLDYAFLHYPEGNSTAQIWLPPQDSQLEEYPIIDRGSNRHGLRSWSERVHDSLSDDKRVVLIAHSGGLPLSMDEVCHVVSSENGLLKHTCKSSPGSSGGALFDFNTGRIVGVHIGNGRAVSIENISSWTNSGGFITESFTVKSLKALEQANQTWGIGQTKPKIGTRSFIEYDD